MAWSPVLDGIELKSQFIDHVNEGSYHKVPVVFGTTSAEGIIFIRRAFQTPLTDLDYIGLLTTIFKNRALDVLSLYSPFPPGADKRPILTELANDYVFLAMQRHLMDRMNLVNQHPIYYWHFNRSFSFDGWGPNYTYCQPLSCHGINIVFLFQSAPEFNREEIILSNEMIKYYANFIKSGDPNKGNLSPKLNWPSFSMQTKYHMQFQTPSFLGSRLLEAKSNFWDRVGYHYGNGAF